MEVSEDQEKNIEYWRIRKIIESLDTAKGNGTSLISLIIPPREQINLINKQMNDELGKAANIKSRVVRGSVQSALTSVRERLRLYNRTPPNGLIIYCGEVLNEQGLTEKKYTIDFEPFKPINTSLYMCDSRFHTEVLKDLLENDDKFGFIIMDGSGALFGVLQGNAREVLTKFAVELPKKHGRGGQSALRFARLRLERRHNYIRRVAETAVKCFITEDKINVTGLVLAGSAEFKKELGQSDLLDGRLSSKILAVVDVAYGGENGFNQAIELTNETLANVKFVREKNLISRFFSEVAQDTRRYCYGIHDTLRAIEMGAVESIILWEDLPIKRIEVKNQQTEEEKVLFLTPKEEENTKNFEEGGAKLEIKTNELLSEWLVNNHKSFGASIEFITNKSGEGSQFVNGFGGIGGFLRYQLDMLDIGDQEDLDDDFDDFI